MTPKIFSLLLSVVLAVAANGCATSKKTVVKPDPQEQFRLDRSLGTTLSTEFEARQSFKKDVEVTVFLRSLALQMSEPEPFLKGQPLGVFLLVDRDVRWQSYSLPGNRIYLSIALLRNTNYENELAAAISFELAHLVRRHAIYRYEHQLKEGVGTRIAATSSGSGHGPSASLPIQTDFFGPRGVLKFTEDELLESADTAVKLLYDAGIDPRGLVSLWTRYAANPKHSPYDSRVTAKLIEQARKSIASFSPLLNPVVRSEAFLTIQKRIRRL